MADVTFNGMTMDYRIVTFRMDAALRREVEVALPGATEQVLLDAYLQAHQERFGKPFLQGDS